MRFSLCLIVLATPQIAFGQTTVTFENATLNQPLSGANTFQNGVTLSPSGSFTTSGVTFNNSYESTFGTWNGWSYSNVSNTTTAGFGNQYAAYNLPTGSGDNSANYAVGFVSYDFNSPFPPTVTPTAMLPAGERPTSIRITNTTYAALSMLNGDQFAKKFGGDTGNDPDFFRLTITGRNASGTSTGSVEFYLADYRFADNSQDYIVKEWTTVDLSSLGSDTTVLSFTLDSSDNGSFGMNTPAYFAADNLVFTPVPEPATISLFAAVVLMARQRIRRAG